MAEYRPSEILRIGTCSISSLNAGRGNRDIGLLVFKTAILSVLEWYGQRWDKSLITEVAEMMHSEYHWLHLAEAKHFAIKAKMGAFNTKESIRRQGDKTAVTEEYDGKIYGKDNLTPEIMLKWMARYADESMITRGEIGIENLTPPKQIEQQTPYVSPEQLEQAYKDFDFMKRGGKTQEQQEQEQRIYAQEKIKQMQRNLLRDQQNPEP